MPVSRDVSVDPGWTRTVIVAFPGPARLPRAVVPDPDTGLAIRDVTVRLARTSPVGSPWTNRSPGPALRP
ncbi:hypothetical protein AB0D74_37545 [Streptomyces sp. NPDC048278]|uniref:hypothetical protein n=1 Tax=Streptomyces sp. NPDC048278 TaxID=3155809 RepID=UPI00342F00E1